MKGWICVVGVLGAGALLVMTTSRQAEAGSLTMVGKVDGRVEKGSARLAFNFYDSKGDQVYRAVTEARIVDGVYTAVLPTGVLESGATYAVVVTPPSKAAPAKQPVATPLVMLQGATPGIQQVGHANISGTLIVGDGVQASSTTVAPAVAGDSLAPDGLAARFTATNGYGIGQTAEGGWVGVYAKSGSGAGLTPTFPGDSAIVANGSYNGVAAKVDSAYGGAALAGCNFGNSPTFSLFIGSAVSGVSSSDSGRGICGSSDANHWGVVGERQWGSTGMRHYGTSTINYGRLGGDYDGVSGEAQISNGNGLIGVANVGGSAYGVWGISSSGYAGYFSGTTYVSGNFYASGKFFRIDHPLDPENKYLIHSCAESNEMLNLYRGTVACNAKGEASVELPSYFSALNEDPSYQLTCIGGYAPVYIASESEGRFRIAGGKPGMRVSWTVYGRRHDPYAEAHPMVVEQKKEGDEAGKLLTPREYGYPKEQGLTYEKEQQQASIERPTSPNIVTRTK